MITVDVEKYDRALSNLVGADNAYFQGDEDVDAIVEVIRLAKKLSDLINQQQKENENLEYKLLGVMHFVDKWLDGAELEQDEVNRASAMREKTLQIVEKLEEENDFLKSIDTDKIKTEAIKEFAERLKAEYSHTLLPPMGYPIDKNDWIVYREDVDDLVKEMIDDKVLWSKQGECPITAEQFNAIYEDGDGE